MLKVVHKLSKVCAVLQFQNFKIFGCVCQIISVRIGKSALDENPFQRENIFCSFR